MKHLITILIPLFVLSCSERQNPKQYSKQNFEITDFNSRDTLFRIPGNDYEPGEDFGYINQEGDTIIPFGQFTQSFTDTIVTYGIVMEKSGGNDVLIGINQKGQRLYEVYWFDNGPDYIEEGMFRIIRNGKIGFADTTGKIVIEPQFECAYPFSNGQARVTFECELEKDLDHSVMKSDNWFYIDKKGIKKQ